MLTTPNKQGFFSCEKSLYCPLGIDSCPHQWILYRHLCLMQRGQLHQGGLHRDTVQIITCEPSESPPALANPRAAFLLTGPGSHRMRSTKLNGVITYRFTIRTRQNYGAFNPSRNKSGQENVRPWTGGTVALLIFSTQTSEIWIHISSLQPTKKSYELKNKRMQYLFYRGNLHAQGAMLFTNIILNPYNKPARCFITTLQMRKASFR